MLARKHARLAVLAAIGIGLAACGNHVCADVGGTTFVTPSDTTIPIGGIATMKSLARAGYCVGDGPPPAPQLRATRWHSSDTIVVALDSMTGRVVGRAVGNAMIADDFQQPAVIRVR